MKRVILRIAALGTVVLLGLIAIAQAQRGTDDPVLAADQRAPAGDATSDDENAPARLSPAATTAAQPLRGSQSAQSGNPLRRNDASASAADQTPPPTVLREDRTGSTSAGPPARSDPFGRRGLPIAPAARPTDGQVDGGANGRVLPASGEATAPPDSEPDRYAQLLDPPATGNPSAPPHTSPGAADAPPTDDRYPQLQPGALEIPDASQLKANPLLSPPAGPQPSDTLPPPDSLQAPASLPAPLAATSQDSGLPGADAQSVGAMPTGEGTGQPGSKDLEGPQSPQLTIQKFAPEQVQVGKPATFRVTVRNTGPIAASGVEIRDRIPKGTRLISTMPRASRGVQGELVWTLGTMKPSDEASVEIELEPIAEGEIGSVASVCFNADASARSFATKPELELHSSAPAQAMIGADVKVEIEVSNPGSGTATGVVLVEQVPPGLQHPVGSDLEYDIGELPPGESRKLELTLVASRPGPVTNLLSVRGEGGLRAEDRLNLEVIAPLLDIAMAGPKKRYLEREATYTLSLHNPGTAAAEQVELVAYLPAGLKFVSANNAGHYDEAERAVYWRLEQLPVDEVGSVELVTMPVEPGEYKIRLRGSAEKCQAIEKEQPVVVEGIAAIMFEVVDVTDPVEMGGETTYEVRVMNQGSKAATNVRLAVLLPPEMQAVAAEGPTRNVCDGNQVIFEGLSRLAPKADTSYRVRAKGLRPGDLRVRVQLQTNEMTSPVVKEESTRVYCDE